jgi:four helix bundle protein
VEAEKLPVYRHALDVVERLEGVARAIPWERRDLRDQLRRAAASVVLNVAEGADEFSPREKARFYRMARRSACECVAVLDVLHRVADPGATQPHRTSLQHVMAQLTLLIQKVDRRS